MHAFGPPLREGGGIVMAHCFEAPDWQTYRMEYRQPHEVLEPLEQETAVVGQALTTLRDTGILESVAYDPQKLLAHRAAVAERFDIPWTAITPRMERLLYAINAIARPRVLVAVGVFCGNTYIANAGAAVGPGRCYPAHRLVGLELRPEEAERARKNVAALTDDPAAELVAADGIDWLTRCEDTIDLLYLDADGRGGRGKSIYFDLLETALPHLAEGALVLAHNSINCKQDLADYFGLVREGRTFRASCNVMIDPEGLEVSRR